MSLMDHLGELRRRLMITVVSLVVAACLLYLVTPQIINLLITPIQAYLPAGDSSLVVLDPLGGFTIRFLVAFFAACVVCAPITLWQFLAFFLPALKPSERRWFIPTFAVGVALFAVGAVFCYFVVLDPAFEWMLAQTADVARILPDATEYLKIVMLLEIAFGFAFELPLLVFYLIVFNVIPYKKFRASWRGVYLGLLVFCAFITPDGSPMTMLLLFVPMVGLYELSMLFARMILARRIRRQADSEAEAREAAQEAGISLDRVRRGARRGDDAGA